jgi:hypothetical protein
MKHLEDIDGSLLPRECGEWEDARQNTVGKEDDGKDKEEGR